MQTSELLDGLLDLFRQELPEAEFLRAWRGTAERQRITGITAVGEIDGETVKPGSEEVRLRFRIYLPEGVGAERAEELFAAMCALAREHQSGFSAISRGAADRDKATGLLAVTCTLSFVEQTGGSGTGSSSGSSFRKQVVLAGRTYQVSGVKTTYGRKSESLVSVGETVPFAVREEETEYTVELDGLDASGLNRLASFTAAVGEGPEATYLNCRWKSISDALAKAVFVSAERV